MQISASDRRAPHALVIGGGRMGTEHVVAIRVSGQFADQVAIVDPDPTVRRRFSEAGDPVFATLAEVDLTTFSLVVVAAPTSLHLGICLQLSAFDVDVLLEKPCGLTPREHEEFLELSRVSRCRIRVGFWRRLCEPFLALRMLLGQGVIGVPRAVLACQWDAFIPSLATQPTSTTGGIGLDCGIHETDTIAWLGMGTVRHLSSVVPRPGREGVSRDDHDQMAAFGVTDKGVAVSISLSRTAGGDDEIFYKVIGELGSLELRLGGTKSSLRVHGQAGVVAVPVVAWPLCIRDALQRQISDGISGGHPYYMRGTVEDGVAAAAPWLDLRQHWHLDGE